ncbi:hypothetical protein Tsubulata_042891 [Turnera subulata]|uniref:Uncharacterized protein n=1 Tax=Turnera subulata TaxID=218843 RepID=A0A9Q0FB13_9ROSI|nr:hypothetical protein Tsubulata_042891 [Turnera subulata]
MNATGGGSKEGADFVFSVADGVGRRLVEGGAQGGAYPSGGSARCLPPVGTCAGFGQASELTMAKADKAITPPKITLTPEDLLVLPTGPRQCSTEELDRTHLNSGFKVRPAPGEIDNWSKTKKSPTGNGFESSRRKRGPGGSFFDSQSRADESDCWVANKPSDPPRSQGGAGDGCSCSGGGLNLQS